MSLKSYYKIITTFGEFALADGDLFPGARTAAAGQSSGGGRSEGRGEIGKCGDEESFGPLMPTTIRFLTHQALGQSNLEAALSAYGESNQMLLYSKWTKKL